MIRRLESGGRLILPSDCPVAGRIDAYYRAYGGEYDFCRFYHGRDTAVMLYGGEVFAWAGGGADTVELGLFLKTLPHFSLIMNDICREGVDENGTAKPLYCMYKRQEQTLTGEDIFTEDYEAVFDVISDAFDIKGKEARDRWYTDTCHRVRHGVSKMLLLCHEGKPAATCTVLYQNRSGAFLSHIGVKKELWGKGLGGRILSLAAGRYGSISLLCEEDKRGFYEHYGFSCEKTAYRILRDEEDK